MRITILRRKPAVYRDITPTNIRHEYQTAIKRSLSARVCGRSTSHVILREPVAVSGPRQKFIAPEVEPRRLVPCDDP